MLVVEQSHDAGTGPSGRRRQAARGGGSALRAEIIAAAIEMLGETGDPAGLTLRAVARRVGVAATSIYLHFDDVDAMILAVKQEMFDQLTAQLERAARRAGTEPAVRIRAIAREYARFGMDSPATYRALFTPLRHRPVDPTLGYVGQQAMDRLALDTGAFLGVDPTDPAALMLSIHLWTALHGMIHLRGSMRAFPWPDLDAEVDTLMDRLLTVR